MVVQVHSDDIEKPKVSKFPVTLPISEGYKYLRLSQYEKAIASLDAALEIQPNNLKSLIGRTKCFMKLGNYSEALQNAEKILELYPTCTEAMALVGDAMYHQGNFEDSSLAFWSGFKIRPYVSEFGLGHQMCKKALDNSLAFDKGITFGKRDVKEVTEILQNATRQQRDRIRGNYRPKYSLEPDLKFVKNLLKDKDLGSISSMCVDLQDYLKKRKRFWRIYKPDTTIRPINKSKERFGQSKIHELLLERCKACERYLLNDDFEACMVTGFEALDLFEEESNSCRSDNLEIKALVLHFLGLASMFKGNISDSLKYHEQELKIGEEHNIPEIKSRASRDIGEDLLKSKDFEEALRYFHRCLTLIDSKEKESIIFYKIADCELHLDRLENSEKNARKALMIAIAENEIRLQCDLTMLLAEIAVKRRKMKEAVGLYNEALVIAKYDGDPRVIEIENLIDIFHKKCENGFQQQISSRTSNEECHSLEETDENSEIWTDIEIISNLRRSTHAAENYAILERNNRSSSSNRFKSEITHRKR